MNQPREFTGRKMLILTVSAFAVIIAVNVTMAVKAVRSFPGLEVENSYVASQTFDAERRAQLALGWTATLSHRGDELRLELTGPDGAPVRAAMLDGTLGRATERADDMIPAFVFDGTAYVAPAHLGPGLWQLWLEAEAEDGTMFRQRLDLRIRA